MRRNYISLAVATALATTMFIGCGGAEDSSGATVATNDISLLSTQRSLQEFGTQKVEKVTISANGNSKLRGLRANQTIANTYAKIYLKYNEEATEKEDIGLTDYITTVKLDENGEYTGFLQIPTNVKTVYAQIPVVGIIEIDVNTIMSNNNISRSVTVNNKRVASTTDKWLSSNDEEFHYLLEEYSKPSSKEVGGIFQEDLVDTTAKNIPVFDYNNEEHRDMLLTSLRINKNQTAVNPDLFSESDNEEILLAKDGEMFVTFYYEVANYRSAFGYFAYDGKKIEEDGTETDLPALPATRDEMKELIKTDATIAFAQASAQSIPAGSRYSGDLTWGDTLSLGKYTAGTKFIFFILPDSWSSGSGGHNILKSYSYDRRRDLKLTTLGLEGFICTMSKFNIEYPESGLEEDFTYVGDMSPDGYKIPDHKHTLYMWATHPDQLDSDEDDKYDRTLVLGFEDLQRNLNRYASRWQGHDFLDLVFGVSTDPNGALTTLPKEPPLPTIEDGDGDGVADGIDAYPADPKRAYNSYYPSEDGKVTLLFEDKWPADGDMDLNDLVVPLKITEVKNAQYEVKDIIIDLSIIASGANYDNGLSIKIDAPADNIEGATINGESVNIVADGNGAIIDIVDNIKTILGYKGKGTYYNTQVSKDSEDNFKDLKFDGDTPYTDEPEDGDGISYNLKVTFKESISNDELGMPPYNPFMRINSNNAQEVHLPKYPATERSGISNEDYISSKGLPWTILIPAEFTKYPLEAIHVQFAYKNYTNWVDSDYQENTDWWEDKAENYEANYIKQ